MLIMTKSVMAMMISFIFSIIWAVFLIPKLKKLKANQSLSIYLEERHSSKKGTPTMGGLIFIIPTIVSMLVLFLMKKINFSYNLLILIFTFLAYALIGFIDDYLIIKRKNNKGLTENQKMIMQIVIAIVFFYLFMISGNEPLLWVHTINFKWDIGWFYGLFILFVLVASSNAVNLTDGLDGLAGGLSVIAFLAFGIITWNTGWLSGYEDIAIFCFILIGSLLGFLIFNVNPAKIFMGDTGSLSLGATLGTLAILTRHELLLIIIGIVFVIETMSCILQIGYYKLTKKRLFKMAPFHHSLEKSGWIESDIVKLFWIIGLIGAMIAITFGVWL
ncbi:MAG: phospho-N-acetylmuramoyl-pentapeptide-transferase [Firmicutes bacterium]|nr:phospho-N-acetylmuramoyl-pentapeptide-transferase [Bacillota bacterium]